MPETVKTNYEVVIAGGGPTGLMLAGELGLAKVDVAIVERRADQALVGMRSGGLHSRTIEIFDQRGIADRFLDAGQIAQVAGFARVRFDISDLPTRHPYGLALWQPHIERILAGWVEELGVPVLRGREVTGFSQDDAGVDVTLADSQQLRARYLVGCDGGRSLVRKAAGIEFRGLDPTTSNLIAEVDVDQEPEFGIHRDALGIHAFSRTEDGHIGIMVTEREVEHATEPNLADLSEALVAVYGTDYGIHSPGFISRFTDATRQAVTYRSGRVLLAGDAAHIHPPDGGQGLQTGIGDAVNLGWKLAQVVKATSSDSLLDTYHAERHPVAGRVIRNTIVNVALRPDDERTAALRETFAELLAMPQPRDTFAATMSGLDIHYDLGKGHSLLGRRMPDLDLVAADGPARVFELLHDARPVLLGFDGSRHPEAEPWADRVQVVTATYEGPWELPVIGPVEAPAAVLVRPDGHVAWARQGSGDGLVAALTEWFGPQRAG
jgi:3-(3-hydroxy-phenyl)propionate hydroxylase